MARINLVNPEEAKGVVKEVFDEVEQVRGKGKISNLVKAYANFPQLLKANWKQMKVVLGGGSLSKKMKEAIAVGLAVVNECTY